MGYYDDNESWKGADINKTTNCCNLIITYLSFTFRLQILNNNNIYNVKKNN